MTEAPIGAVFDGSEEPFSFAIGNFIIPRFGYIPNIKKTERRDVERLRLSLARGLQQEIVPVLKGPGTPKPALQVKVLGFAAQCA